ncbi:MAG: 2-phosphosulfolactate phosphatase [Parachlamydia sp.]|nr:2-phosphosulfolactate phosphatase [Parachlamydia sp.]
MHSPHEIKVTVVIDVFRSFTTACYILKDNPRSYKLAETCTTISRLAREVLQPVLIGKPEPGSNFVYTIPNSPARVRDLNVSDKHVLHRTTAGAKGVLLAKGADMILVAGFINAEATAVFIRKLYQPVVTYMPMGHEGTTPSMEDDLCSNYIQALINGKKIDLQPFIPKLKEGPGKYFFGEDQWQYPKDDFDLCLERGRFIFAIQAIVEGDYATLKKVGETQIGESGLQNILQK